MRGVTVEGVNPGAPVARTGLRGARVACFVAAFVLACATTPPVSVRSADPVEVTRQQEMSALTGRLSNPTLIVLRRQDLRPTFEENPHEAIARLHELIDADEGTRDTLFALAETSFLTAEHATSGQAPRAPVRARGVLNRHEPAPERAPAKTDRRHADYLASAVYAFAFLFGEGDRAAIGEIDPRAQIAASLYNRAVAAAFSTPEGNFELRAGSYELPFGTLEVGFDPAPLVWGARRLTGFRPVADIEVLGLRNRYRKAGIGAPLLAEAVLEEGASDSEVLGLERIVVSATAVLRLEKPRAQLRGTHLQGRLDLYRGRGETSLAIGGHQVPLQLEPSAALAATLEGSGVWEGEIAAFFGRALDIERQPRIFALEPATPGQIPVVFVHGTSSNPAIWADMVNDISDDPRLGDRFSFWFFSYDSGNPIMYSGMWLRRALLGIVSALDPGESDACLRDMVVIGHSQGGLLTKLTAIDSGTRLWDAHYDVPFEEVELRPENRALLEEAAFLEPLPFVRRIVFIATPHRGSYLANLALARRLTSRLVRFPAALVGVGADLAGLQQKGMEEPGTWRIATSLDNMSPGNVFIRGLVEIPVAPGIAKHSIVAVDGTGPVEDGNDGVVKFSSAHQPDADSELIVRSGHSTLANPHTINEVERILRLHADTSTCASVPPAQAG